MGKIFIKFTLPAFLFAAQSSLLAQVPAPGPYNPATIKINYIRTWDALAPEQSENALLLRPVKDVRMTTQYIDGLGRPLQTVLRQGSQETGGTASDMVSAMVYDELGREQLKYLPFGANNIGGNSSINDGLFKLNPFQQQAAFMGVQYAGQNESYYYSKTNFDASPLNNSEKAMAAGNSWSGSNRGIENKYWVNKPIDDVKIFGVTNSGISGIFGSYAKLSAINNGVYLEGQLYKKVTDDEHGKQIIEFRDKDGKIILKKVQLTASIDNGTGDGHGGWICTYYIYDNLNNLRCVIQPEGVKWLADNGWNLSDAIILNDQCFRYEYDLRNRMIMRKVPGAGEEYLVYDQRERLIMKQDAKNRLQNKWLITKYDELNRPIETGLLNNNGNTFEQHQTAANGSISYPATLSGYEMLTATHYDNYTGLPSGLNDYLSTWSNYFSSTDNINWPYPQLPQKSLATKGMVTWLRTKILGSVNTFINTVRYYDDKGRVIQVQSTNITGGLDVTTSQYNWAGQPLIAVQRQQKNDINPQEHLVITNTTYDDLGRVIKVEKTVNSIVDGVAIFKPKQQILQNEYDKLGQLKTKKLGANNLETLNFEYNIRGWMLGTNRSYTRDGNNTNYFGFDLGYDKQYNDLIAGQSYNSVQYNGNISGLVWKSKGDGEKRKYDFTYDANNRLLKADFTQFSNSTFNQSADVNFDLKMGDGSLLPNGQLNPYTAYDANGNIKRMQLWGLKVGGSSQIDNLKYTYYEKTNRLKSVTDFNNDINTTLGDFKTAASHTQASLKASLGINSPEPLFNAITDYSYDINGNLQTDENKKINSIEYNHLNLPIMIYITSGTFDKAGQPTPHMIEYTYDAAGNKLEMVVHESFGDYYAIKTTQYIAGFVYQESVLKSIPHEEGRIRYKPVTTAESASFQFDYMLKDHLGNVRMVLTEEQNQDTYPAATLENVHHNGGNAISIEDDFYSVNTGNVVAKIVAGGIPDYPNHNGNPPYNSNPYSNTAANSDQLYLLNATTNTVSNKTGLGIVLKVMAGDNINIFGKSYHRKPSGGSYSDPTNGLLVSELINAFAGTGIVSGHGVTGTQITAQSGFPTTLNGLIGNQPAQVGNRPKAAINWIVLDEQFKYVSGGFDMVGIDGFGSGVLKTHDLSTIPAIDIPKNGYIYVYCSNESQYNVFFDNLQVIHNRGAILEETHYYPFGLTMKGISPKALNNSPANRYKFNGIEHNNSFDLNMYDAFYRNLDPQIGRFWQIDVKPVLSESPYGAMSNNPILNMDPLGDTIINGQKMEAFNGAAATYLANVTINVIKPNPVKRMYIEAIKTSPSLAETMKKVMPWDKIGELTSDQLRKFFIKSLNEFPLEHRQFATSYFNRKFNNINKVGGQISKHLVFTEFLEYGLALANGQVGPLPDPTGLSSMIVNNVSADLDEDLVNMAIKNTMSGAITPDALLRTLTSVERRNHGISVNGTYVSAGELTDIYLNGGILNPNYLQFPNYGFGSTPPTKDGIKYSIFVLYTDKMIMPLRDYGIR